MKNFKLSKYLPEIVYGGNDGIVTTFAIVASFLGAGSGEGVVIGSSVVVLLFGLANLFGDSVSMGLGDFLSERSKQDKIREKRKEVYNIIENNPQIEVDKTKKDLEMYDLSEDDKNHLIEIYKRNKKLWNRYILVEQMHLPVNSEEENPKLKGFFTALSFIVFGSIPLLPFALFTENGYRGFISIGFTIFALFLLGVFRWYLAKSDFLRTVTEVMFIGSIAAVVAYFVGLLFR